MGKVCELYFTFTFDYEVNKNDQLRCLLWADPISRKNFSLFGDVVSFDAKYKTNRYSMIFTPFTGKDNHERLVTFDAALMSSEDDESYSWVLPDTRHRLCMWHIMFKVPYKLLVYIRKNETFRKRDMHTPTWTVLMSHQCHKNDSIVVLEVKDGFGATNKVVHNKVEDSTTCKFLKFSIHELRDGFLSSDIEDDTLSKKNRLFSEFYGLSAPSEVEVLPPDFVKTKGSGSRIKSKEETNAERKKKPLRTCKKCNKKCNHDSRNCEKK
ncbi:hypothetical protein C2S52_018724 [Perilla frutescens var. hirtella]|nr:hypothetical protein C2S52_018724 [Perilla frutescens var. hirtella]